MRKTPKFIVSAHLIVLAILMSHWSCTSTKTQTPELTFAAQRGEFVIRLDAQGVTEAKKAHTVVAPQLNWISTQVAWLPPEGKYVKKGDIVADLEASQIENKYLNARSEVEIAKADAEKGMAELALEYANLQSQAKNTQASLNASRLQLDRMEFESVQVVDPLVRAKRRRFG